MFHFIFLCVVVLFACPMLEVTGRQYRECREIEPPSRSGPHRFAQPSRLTHRQFRRWPSFTREPQTSLVTSYGASLSMTFPCLSIFSHVRQLVGELGWVVHQAYLVCVVLGAMRPFDLDIRNFSLVRPLVPCTLCSHGTQKPGVDVRMWDREGSNAPALD